MKDKIETESVRIYADVLDRVRNHVNSKRLHIAGFVSNELTKVMDRIDKKKKVTQP